MVHAGCGNLVEIVLGDPRVPVVLKIGLSLILAEVFAIGVLVYHTVAQRENRWRDPWLKDKPAAKIDTPNFVGVVIESHSSLAEMAFEVQSAQSCDHIISMSDVQGQRHSLNAAQQRQRSCGQVRKTRSPHDGQ